MATRLIEVVLPAGRDLEIEHALSQQVTLGHTTLLLNDGRVMLRIVIDSDETERVLDRIDKEFGALDGFRAVVLNVEATLPRAPEESAASDSGTVDAPEKTRIGPSRVSREELYHRVSEHAEIGPAFTVTVCLSTVVAAVGLLRGDLAVIIGAMVIAPLLGPNVALALATTLADNPLMRRALRTNVFGVSLALGLSLAAGWLLPVDPMEEAIMSRTRVAFGDVVLALAAGSAGALAYTSAVPAALIGVMVAVALLPPLVVGGLLAASGEIRLAAGAGLLVAINVISVNLAGVVTFLWQGVRPRTWWEADRARHATRRAITIWLMLLVALGLLATLAGNEC